MNSFTNSDLNLSVKNASHPPPLINSGTTLRNSEMNKDLVLFFKDINHIKRLVYLKDMQSWSKVCSIFCLLTRLNNQQNFVVVNDYSEFLEKFVNDKLVLKFMVLFYSMVIWYCHVSKEKKRNFCAFQC